MLDMKTVRIACKGSGTARIENLNPFQGELKSLSKKNYQKLRKEIIDLGFSEPIAVWRHNRKLNILNGHQRLRVLSEMKRKDGYKIPPIPIVEVEAKNKKEAKLKVLALTSQYGEMSDEGLYEFMNTSSLSMDDLKESFSFPEINLQRFEFSYFDKKSEQDDVPEKPKTPMSKVGDLWKLGNHNIFCGDSTDKKITDRLFHIGKPFMMVTDPPYGVNYDPKWRAKFGIRRAEYMQDQPDDEVVWASIYEHFIGDVIYVWHASIFATPIALELEKNDFEIRNQLIWRKQHFAISRGHYNWQHEPCWYAVRSGKTAQWCGGQSETTVWDISNLNPFGGNKEEDKTPHAAQKPVECMARPIRNHGRKGDYIFDPFVGSGTTIIACEQLERRCLSIEIDPGWVDVAIERWQNLTGGHAKKI